MLATENATEANEDAFDTTRNLNGSSPNNENGGEKQEEDLKKSAIVREKII